MSELDLNNLVPQSVQVRIGTDLLELQPPTLKSYFLIMKLSKMLQEDANADEADKLQADLLTEMHKLCPGLEKHSLNTAQLIALTTEVATMAQPETTAKGGVAGDAPKATNP